MAVRHDCFIVHAPADTTYADAFVARYRDVFVPRTRGVSDQDRLEAAEGPAREAMLHAIRQQYIWEARVTILLLGRCTWASRYVDWELAAALRDDEIGKRTGLLGLRLPYLGTTVPTVVPERFADNVDAGFAVFHGYPASSEELRAWVEEALVNAQYEEPDNSRPLRESDGSCP